MSSCADCCAECCYGYLRICGEKEVSSIACCHTQDYMICRCVKGIFATLACLPYSIFYCCMKIAEKSGDPSCGKDGRVCSAVQCVSKTVANSSWMVMEVCCQKAGHHLPFTSDQRRDPPSGMMSYDDVITHYYRLTDV